MPFVTTSDGTDLFYKDWGQGAPIVLIHGWPLNADMWEYQAPFLVQAGFRVIAYDRRGFGRSAQPWSGYDYDTFAADLQTVLEHLDLRGVTLAGFSMGGGEVARYLARYGHARIARAALIGAVTPYLLKDGSNPDGVDPSVFAGMIEGLKADRPEFLATFAKQFFGVGIITSPVSNGILQWSSFMALQASPKATIDCVHAFSATDFRADLKAITVPTLVIHGTSDHTVPIGISARKAAAAISGANLIEYHGEPHGLFMTAKDRLAQDLATFAKGNL